MIWKTQPTLEALTQRSQNTMSAFLGVEFTEIGADFLKATMPVHPPTKQPMGLLHGGASVALAETLGSVASVCCIDPEHETIVGLEINANHIRSVKDGVVEAVCTPIHLGKSTHIWSIEIKTPEGQLVCTSRLTVMVLKKK